MGLNSIIPKLNQIGEIWQRFRMYYVEKLGKRIRISKEVNSMAIVYTKAELLDKIDECLSPEKVSVLYAQNFVNYLGITYDTKEKYTEVIAERLLNNLGAFEKVGCITRKGSYKIGSHKWKPINPTSPRIEEQIARSMINNTYPYIGKIIDYQTPLKNVRDDTAGKIDLLSWNEQKKCIYIIELKVPKDKEKAKQETLLRCILEIETYSRIVDSEKLLADFQLPANTVLRKAVLVYQNSLPHTNIHDANMKKLMKELKVDLLES